MVDHLDTARDMIGTLGLSTTPHAEPCQGCGAVVPAVPDGPTHPYLDASPGCWALYTVMLGREFSAFDAEVHRLSVDTYAVQHPGEPSPQTIQSVCVHLVALCLTFEHDQTVAEIRPIMGEMSKGKYFEPRWLDPVPEGYSLTILNLLDATTPDAYGEQVRRWSRATWEAWTAHHDEVREWAGKVLAHTRGQQG